MNRFRPSSRGEPDIAWEEEEKVLGPGEVVLIPANTEHELEILEDMEIINCKDVVSGWSVYHARWEK